MEHEFDNWTPANWRRLSDWNKEKIKYKFQHGQIANIVVVTTFGKCILRVSVYSVYTIYVQMRRRKMNIRVCALKDLLSCEY